MHLTTLTNTVKKLHGTESYASKYMKPVLKVIFKM